MFVAGALNFFNFGAAPQLTAPDDQNRCDRPDWASRRDGARHPGASAEPNDGRGHAVVARNNAGCLRYPLSDSAIRTRRVRYVRHADALYIPAWANLDSWYETPPPELECDVSEVEGRACWRYVWLRGRAIPLHPHERRP
jgi:hypothetical protein